MLTGVYTRSIVLLTGVGREGQVGETVANAFAALGASLVLVDRTADRVEARAAAITAGGGIARSYSCDLTDPDAVGDLVNKVRASHGDKLRALVHMAGGFEVSGPVAESSVDVWRRQLGINLTSAYLTARAFLPMLRADKGSLLFFSSQAALPGSTGEGISAYAIAKHGVAALARAIAAEEAPNGVRANALAPTAIRTTANLRSMGDGVPYVEREEVANVVTYLCSERASAISGQLVALSTVA
jgi:NAD(P)-dependent dehydrogenase (short-subunit alcohol dehydrogenase family)